MTTVLNQQELARTLGCGQSNISKMLHDPEWCWGRGPWSDQQVQEISAWREQRRTLNNAPADLSDRLTTASRVLGAKYQQARTRLVEKRIEALEMELKRVRHQTLDRDQVKGWFCQHMEMVKGQLASLPGMVGLWGLSP